MRTVGFVLCAMMLSFPAFADNGQEVFAQEIIKVFASGDTKAYMNILHPDCPAPNPDRLAWQMSNKWIADKADIRFKNVADSYDRSQLDFSVEPEQVIEFQVWTVKDGGDKTELVTSYPIAKYKSEFKILDYPCFKPK